MLSAVLPQGVPVRNGSRARSHAHGHPLARAALHLFLIGLAAFTTLLVARLAADPDPSPAPAIPFAPLSGVRAIAAQGDAFLRPGVSHTTVESPLRVSYTSPAVTARATEVASRSSFTAGLVGAAAGSGENGIDTRPLVDQLDPREPYVFYTVRPGDNLHAIATEYETTVDNILINNAEVNEGGWIPVGQQILVPFDEGILYKVGHGEALSGIIEGYLNVTVEEITSYRPNNLLPGGDVQPGQYVLLPGAEPKPPPRQTPGGRPYQDYGVPEVSLGRFSLPLAAWGYISDTYGTYRGPGRIHTGIDLALGTHPGSSIYAACDGWVSRTEWLTYSYGYYVIVDCGDGWETLYSHFSEITVSWGQNVTKGETVLGVSGSTGFSTGEHLHFEVRYNGVPLDPEQYLDFY